jgi:hypothetical protein
MPTPTTFEPTADPAFPDDVGAPVWSERRTLPVAAFYGVPAAFLGFGAVAASNDLVRLSLGLLALVVVAFGIRAHRRALIETFEVSDRFLTVVQPGGGRVAVPLSSIDRVTMMGDKVRVDASVGTLTLGFVRRQKALIRALEQRAPGAVIDRDITAFCPT